MKENGQKSRMGCALMRRMGLRPGCPRGSGGSRYRCLPHRLFSESRDEDRTLQRLRCPDGIQERWAGRQNRHIPFPPSFPEPCRQTRGRGNGDPGQSPSAGKTVLCAFQAGRWARAGSRPGESARYSFPLAVWQRDAQDNDGCAEVRRLQDGINGIHKASLTLLRSMPRTAAAL